jgi:signal transduction histidine kinase/CheY-like chemotaxis protein
LFVGWLHLCVTTWLDGGIYSLKNHWYLVVILANYYVISRRSGFVWLVIVLLSLMAQTWMGQYMPPAGPGLQAWDRAVMSLIDFLVPLVSIFIVPQYYQRLFDDALALNQRRQHELQAKQRELEHTLLMREHFISSVSHELRTPMNAILGLNTLLYERVQNKPQAQKVLAYTRQSADHLMTVINDVLDYSQFQFGQIKARVERFELRTTVNAAFELFKPRIESTRLQYSCEIDPDVPHWVDSDRHRLMQVLVNLLGNAIKFTHRGSVTLRVRRVDQGVEFSVQDTGIGIAPHQQSKIFERFSQADDHIQSDYGGSGLGLTISLRLVQMMGGRMQLKSVEGQGSQFVFWLPLTAKEALQSSDHIHRHHPQLQTHAYRFLVVDDHPVNRLLAKQVLLREWPDSTVDECENGAVALDRLQAGQGYDMMLIDMVMPVMDGIEATRRVRSSSDALLRSLPILGLTANVSEQDLTRFQQAGLNGLLLKPFDLERMRAEVASLLAHP